MKENTRKEAKINEKQSTNRCVLQRFVFYLFKFFIHSKGRRKTYFNAFSYKQAFPQNFRKVLTFFTIYDKL